MHNHKIEMRVVLRWESPKSEYTAAKITYSFRSQEDFERYRVAYNRLMDWLGDEGIRAEQLRLKNLPKAALKAGALPHHNSSD